MKPPNATKWKTDTWKTAIHTVWNVDAKTISKAYCTWDARRPFRIGYATSPQLSLLCVCCAVRCCSLKWSSGSYLHVCFQFQFSIATTREMGKNSHATNNKCSPMNIACNAWRWSAPSVCPYYCIITAITKRTTQMRTELMDTLAYYRSCIIHLYKQFPPSSTYIHRRFWRQASWIVSSFYLLKPFKRLAASLIRRTDTQWHVYESRRLRVHQ